MTYKLFLDLMSQPSRALYIFFKLTKIPVDIVPVALRKGEHLTEEFKENISRFQKVPVLHDNKFKLTESIAIVRYLARENNIPDNWYPRSSKRQARVDEYLEWQHNNTRAKCAMYFLNKVIYPNLLGITPDPVKIQKLEQEMSSCLDSIETLWLSQNRYIAGNEISVADLFAACEIEQPRMAGYDPKNGRPKLAEWLDRVRQETNPFYDEAHEVLNRAVSVFGKEQAKL
ncbi:glutathione S-transferase [Rhyzopertha dominica]|nr:glutathione S-transferase [Rhyzopertha dominica]